MLKALNIATQGLLQAEKRATDLARDILETTSEAANFSLEDDAPANTAALASARTGAGKPTGSFSGDLLQQMVDLKSTELAFKANAKVFERADEVLGTLLDDEG